MAQRATFLVEHTPRGHIDDAIAICVPVLGAHPTIAVVLGVGRAAFGRGLEDIRHLARLAAERPGPRLIWAATTRSLVDTRGVDDPVVANVHGEGCGTGVW